MDTHLWLDVRRDQVHLRGRPPQTHERVVVRLQEVPSRGAPPEKEYRAETWLVHRSVGNSRLLQQAPGCSVNDRRRRAHDSSQPVYGNVGNRRPTTGCSWYFADSFVCWVTRDSTGDPTRTLVTLTLDDARGRQGPADSPPLPLSCRHSFSFDLSSPRLALPSWSHTYQGDGCSR